MNVHSIQLCIHLLSKLDLPEDMYCCKLLSRRLQELIADRDDAIELENFSNWMTCNIADDDERAIYWNELMDKS